LKESRILVDQVLQFVVQGKTDTHLDKILVLCNTELRLNYETTLDYYDAWIIYHSTASGLVVYEFLGRHTHALLICFPVYKYKHFSSNWRMHDRYTI